MEMNAVNSYGQGSKSWEEVARNAMADRADLLRENTELKNFSAGLEANLAAVIQRAEAADRELAEARHQIGELLLRAYKYDDKPHQLYSHIMVMAKGHSDEAEIRRFMDLRYNGCHDEKKDAEALRALAAWGMDEAGRSVDFSQGAEVYVWLSWIAHIADEVGNNRDSVCGEGVTLAAAIMDALGKANANRAA